MRHRRHDRLHGGNHGGGDAEDYGPGELPPPHHSMPRAVLAQDRGPDAPQATSCPVATSLTPAIVGRAQVGGKCGARTTVMGIFREHGAARLMRGYTPTFMREYLFNSALLMSPGLAAAIHSRHVVACRGALCIHVFLCTHGVLVIWSTAVRSKSE